MCSRNKFPPKDTRLSRDPGRRESPTRRVPTSTAGSPVKRDRTSPLSNMAGQQDSRSNFGPDRTNGPTGPGGRLVNDQPGFGSQGNGITKAIHLFEDY